MNELIPVMTTEQDQQFVNGRQLHIIYELLKDMDILPLIEQEECA